MLRFAFLTFVPVALVFAQAASQPPAAPAAAREPGLYATINTSQGAITVKLFEQETPVTVKNFVALARGGKSWRDQKTGQKTTRALYPGTVFHRVIPGFMIQGGDPTGTGAGDPGFVIPDEFAPSLKFDQPGRLAMANAGPRTGNVQFFITLAPTPHLNGLHTIFGQVVEGQDVVQKIAAAPRDANDRPRTAIRIASVVTKREGAPPAGVAPAAKPAAPKPPAAKPPAAKPAKPAAAKSPAAKPATKK